MSEESGTDIPESQREGIVMRPLETPWTGKRIFNGDLMAEITQVRDGEFDFFVHNGGWDGTYRDGEGHVHRTGDRIPMRRFEEVVSIDRDAADRWYTDPMRNIRGGKARLEMTGQSGETKRFDLPATGASVDLHLPDGRSLGVRLTDEGVTVETRDNTTAEPASIVMPADGEMMFDAPEFHDEDEDCTPL